MVLFRCYHGHVIGEIRRVNGISKLFIFDDPSDDERQIRAVITGSAEVVCITCGEMRHWQSNQTLKSIDTHAIM